MVKEILSKLGFEKKADRQVGALYPQQWHRVEHSGDDLRKIAKEGYNTNPYVKACIDMKAQAMATLPIIIEKRLKGGKTERVYDHKALEVLNNPNEMMSKTEFLRQICSDYQQFGMSFTAMASADRGEFRGQPQFMYPLITEKVKIVQGTPRKPIARYEYRGAETIPYRTDEVMYIKNYSPYDYYVGTSDVYSIAHVVDLCNEMIKWNNSLLRNNGTPPVAIYIENGAQISEEQAQKIKDRYQQVQSGVDNAGKIFVGGGGMRIEKIGFDTNELDWVNGIHTAGEMICIGLNMPPPLVMSHKSVTSGDRKLMERQLYMNEILPKGKILMEHLTRSLLRKFPNSEDLSFVIDKDQVWALLDDIETKHKTVRADFLAGIASHNESRTEVQFDTNEDDYFVQPMNVSQGGSDVNPDSGGNGRGNTEDNV